MKLFIIGDSHTGALERGRKDLETRGELPLHIDITIRALGTGFFFTTPFFTDRGDYAEVVEPSYRKAFERLPLPEEGNIEVVYGLCGPLHSARIWRHRDWRTFAPVALAKGEAPVSAAMTRRIVIDDVKYILSLIDIFKRLGKHVFVIEPPRPFRHHPALTLGTRPEVVIRVDMEYREIVRHELANRSISIISVPPLCIDTDGFMLSSFKHGNSNDHHHANYEFGEIMLKAIFRYLEDR